LKDNIKQCGILAYADEVIILGLDIQEVKMGTKELIINSKDIGLQINNSKIKYIIISFRDNIGEHLKVEDYKFERVHSFKYLDIIINSKNNNHEVIKIRKTAVTNNLYIIIILWTSEYPQIKTSIA